MSLSVLLPSFVVLPTSAVLMLIVAAHLRMTYRSAFPASRRRIRTANGWVMLLAIPVLAAGFSLIDPKSNPTEWLLIWLFAVGLLSLSVMLAALDIANTLRLARKSNRLLRRRLRSLHHELVRTKCAPDETASGERQGAGA